MAVKKGTKKLTWKNDDSLVEVVKLLTPYMSYADIGRLLGRDRRTIHYVAKTYGVKSNSERKLPLIIIKDKDKFENDLLTLKDLEK